MGFAIDDGLEDASREAARARLRARMERRSGTRSMESAGAGSGAGMSAPPVISQDTSEGDGQILVSVPDRSTHRGQKIRTEDADNRSSRKAGGAVNPGKSGEIRVKRGVSQVGPLSLGAGSPPGGKVRRDGLGTVGKRGFGGKRPGDFSGKVSLGSGSPFSTSDRRVSSRIAGRLSGLALILPRIIPLVILVVAVLGISSCVSSCFKTPSGSVMNAMPQVGNSVFERGIELATREDVDSAAMASFIGDDLADTLSQAANTNDDAYWIGTNVDVYSEFGWAVQRKLLRLAAMQPDALPYVRGFPSYYPSEQGYTEGADSGAIPDENNVDGVPILYQWDTRWGYLDYGGLAFGLAGCCPTALSMAYQGLTGDTSMTPADMAIFAEEQGRVVYNGGTDGVLLENLGQLGLVGRITASNADSIIWELKNGAILIANVGPGDFTEGGHFITLTGVDADGLIVVNDPYSVTNTEKRWDASTIASQTKVLYAIRLA